MRKITDLEKFALEEIFRPFYPMLVDYEKNGRMEKLDSKFNLETVLLIFKENQEFMEHCMDRISKIGFFFPDYIDHPVVEFIKNWKKT